MFVPIDYLPPMLKINLYGPMDEKIVRTNPGKMNFSSIHVYLLKTLTYYVFHFFSLYLPKMANNLWNKIYCVMSISAIAP